MLTKEQLEARYWTCAWWLAWEDEFLWEKFNTLEGGWNSFNHPACPILVMQENGEYGTHKMNLNNAWEDICVPHNKGDRETFKKNVLLIAEGKL